MAILTSEISYTPKVKGYLCPECGARHSSKKGMGAHREKQHGIANDWTENGTALAHTPTSEIAFRNGGYKCPECGEKYAERRMLGRHRMKHGVQGTAASTLARRKALATTSTAKGAENVIQPTPPQPPSSNGASRKNGKAGWTDESLAGFVFAHVHTLIEDACAGREDVIPNITERLSELLHAEVHGQQARRGRMGLLRGLP